MVGEFFKKERERLRLSQRELALKAEVSRKHLSDFENGANVSIDIVRRLARALEIKKFRLSDDLLVLDDHGTPRTLAAADIRSVVDRVYKDVGHLRSVVGSPAEKGNSNLASVTQIRDRPVQTGGSSDERRVPDIFSGYPLPANSPVMIVSPDELEVDEVLCEVAGRAAAGTGIEYVETGETVWVPRTIAPNPLKDEHILRAVGDSMVDFGIEDGDYLIVQRRKGGVAAKGEVVIGWLMTQTHEGLVVKIWWRGEGNKMLLSANRDHQPIILNEERGDTFELQGIVRYSFRRQHVAIREFPKVSG